MSTCPRAGLRKPSQTLLKPSVWPPRLVITWTTPQYNPVPANALPFGEVIAFMRSSYHAVVEQALLSVSPVRQHALRELSTRNSFTHEECRQKHCLPLLATAAPKAEQYNTCVLVQLHIHLQAEKQKSCGDLCCYNANCELIRGYDAPIQMVQQISHRHMSFSSVHVVSDLTLRPGLGRETLTTR